MILVDFSSILHRMIHNSVASIKPAKENGMYVTSEFAGLLCHNILESLFRVSQEHKNKFGDMVICIDNHHGGYWRCDVFPGYKQHRKKNRDTSEINFDEVFKYTDELIEQLKNNLPWKVVDVPRTEADDAMLVLAREYNKYENILIYSPDKDMIQAQRNTDNVYQYSALTQKWLVPENKHDNMEHWITEHVCLGDASDGVPKVVDGTEFSENFLKYLEEKDIDIKTPMDFRNSNLSVEDKRKLLESFGVYKTDRKGESTGILDVYKGMKFGPAALAKKIKEFGSVDGWLNSHPMYKEHYDRNYTLVMEEGIPSKYWNEILLAYKTASTDYNDKIFKEYLNENGLYSIVTMLPNVFKLNRELTAEDFGW